MPASDHPPDDLHPDDHVGDAPDITPEDLPPQDDLPDDPLDTGEYAIAYGDPQAGPDDEDAPQPDAERLPAWTRWWARRHWALYLAAFLTPLVVTGALFALLLTLDTDDDPLSSGPADAPQGAPSTSAFAPSTATPDPNLTPGWPANIQFNAHTVPARIRHIFSAQGEHHGYQFEGSAGDAWFITVEPYQRSGTDPILMLYGPDGTRICEAANCAASAPRSQLTVVLETSGTYRVVISSASGLSTGYYLLTVNDE